MPSEHQSASRVNREQFETIKAEIGEDPARWLDRPLLQPSQMGSDPAVFIQARIDGIRSVDVCRQWIEVERELERGPRTEVVQWLNQRMQTLKDDATVSDDPFTRASALADGGERDV